MDVKRILMILTSHRLDCCRLAMDLLAKGDSFQKFDHVVLLMNGVDGGHRKYLDRYMASRPDISWDVIAGPRGRGERISGLQNECVRRFPNSLYFKIDEDTFVSEDWVEKLTHAYEQHRADPNLSLITPVIPNNSAGFHFLINAFPELAAEYRALFSHPVTPECAGTVWKYPQVAEWITRKFLNLRDANQALEAAQEKSSVTAYPRFSFRFSINCIVYDYRHWSEMGGIAKDDEIGWGDWIQANKKYVVQVTNALVHHYSFFIQQDWLDRSTLLEDIRESNIPGSTPLFGYHGPRLMRTAKQVPGAMLRRLQR